MGQSAEELRRDIERTREDLGDHLDAIGDRVSPSRIAERRKNRMRDSVSSMRERVMGTPNRVMGSVSERSSSVSQSVTDSASGAAETLRSAPDAARQQAQGNPLLAGAVAFGAGFAVAALFPGTQTEAQVAQSLAGVAEPLKEEATMAAKEVASAARDAGQEAAQQLKESASESAQQVKETAQASAQHTKEAGTQAAQDVRQEASST